MLTWLPYLLGFTGSVRSLLLKGQSSEVQENLWQRDSTYMWYRICSAKQLGAHPVVRGKVYCVY